MSDLNAPAAIRWVAATLEEAGYETWAVGGAVRDALAGNPSGDWDLATRATPDRVRELFTRTVPIGLDHGTVGVLARDGTLYEVTTFRRDVRTTGRHAEVAFAETLDEDLARRDFTINAVAWHPLRKVVHDPLGGRKDMVRRVLRTVGDPVRRFEEDYLRVLRGLRFAGMFRMTFEAETWRALTDAVNRLDILSPERIREEMDKMLGGEEPPSRGLALYAASGALGFLYPEIDRTVGLRRAGKATAGGRDGTEFDAAEGEWFSHALRTVDELSPARVTLRWAALLQGIGEPDPIDGESGDRGERALLRSAAVLERLRSSKARIREVSELVGFTAHAPESGSGDAELRRWLARAGRNRLPSHLRLWSAIASAEEARRGMAGGTDGGDRLAVAELGARLREIARSGTPLAVDELALNGRDLISMGYAPGPHFGEVLAFLLDRVLDEPALDTPETLADEAVRWLEAQGVFPKEGG